MRSRARTATASCTAARATGPIAGRPDRRRPRTASTSPRCPTLRSLREGVSVNVLLTNDDGIEAEGLQTLRRALAQVADVNLAVIAPDGNRSATARSITT